MWSLLWRLEQLETGLATVRSEWDAVINQYNRQYSDVEIIEIFYDLSHREMDIKTEIVEVKESLRDAARRES